uniref:Uncharacterized protein n=1 Tax=Megaselia scalaris TaxID=36166 RepID=T1GRV1_MEGSC
MFESMTNFVKMKCIPSHCRKRSTQAKLSTFHNAFRERGTDQRFSRLENGKRNTDHGKNGKRKNILLSTLNQAHDSLWEISTSKRKELFEMFLQKSTELPEEHS